LAGSAVFSKKIVNAYFDFCTAGFCRLFFYAQIKAGVFSGIVEMISNDKFTKKSEYLIRIKNIEGWR